MDRTSSSNNLQSKKNITCNQVDNKILLGAGNQTIIDLTLLFSPILQLQNLAATKYYSRTQTAAASSFGRSSQIMSEQIGLEIVIQKYSQNTQERDSKSNDGLQDGHSVVVGTYTN